MVGKPDWGGTPVTHGEDIVINDSRSILGGGTSYTLQALLSRPGYQIGLTLQDTTIGGSSMPVPIDMVWVDSVTLQTVSHQQWAPMAASRTNSHIVIGQGPTGGDKLIVKVTNLGVATDTLQASVLVAESSIGYSEHDWRTDDGSGMLLNGIGSIGSAMIDNMLAAQGPVSTGHNVLDTFALPLYSGRARLYINTSSLTSDLLWNVSTISGAIAASSFTIAAGSSDTAGNVAVDVWLPRGQCALVWKNLNAAAVNVTASMVVGGR